MRFAFAFSALLAFSACAGAQPHGGTDTVPTPTERHVRPIQLVGPVADRASEISGLTWYGDTLVILPQYPARFAVGSDSVDAQNRGGDRGALFALSRAEIEAYLDASAPAPLRPWAVPFEAPGVPGTILGFEGYEAVAFRDGQVFMTIEFEHESNIQGYLIAGTVAPHLGGVRLDTTSLQPLPSQTRIGNLSYETILLVPGGVVALQEANGTVVNPHPEAYVFDPTLAMRDSLSIPNVEYRLTDATSLDAAGRFWALNYFYPGDRLLLQPAPDSLAIEFGDGPTHRRFHTVERLVEMQYTGDEIVRTDHAPIQLELLGDDRPRNWEGIARLGTRGFLMATDKFPETMLAFVAASPPAADE